MECEWAGFACHNMKLFPPCVAAVKWSCTRIHPSSLSLKRLFASPTPSWCSFGLSSSPAAFPSCARPTSIPDRSVESGQSSLVVHHRCSGCQYSIFRPKVWLPWWHLAQGEIFSPPSTHRGAESREISPTGLSLSNIHELGFQSGRIHRHCLAAIDIQTVFSQPNLALH